MSDTPALVSTPDELTRVFLLLKERGVHQHDVASDLGRSQTQVSLWKRGTYPVPRYVGHYLYMKYGITRDTLLVGPR